MLADYLHEEQSRLVKDKNVLELGAGGGLPSLVAGALGAHKVVCTDYPDKALLSNLTRNRDENAHAHAREGGGYEMLAGKVVVEGHLWGKQPEVLLDLIGNEAGKDDDVNKADVSSEARQHDATAGPSRTHSPSVPRRLRQRRRRFDTLILSDLIFNHSQHAALLDSCEALIEPSEGLLSETSTSSAAVDNNSSEIPAGGGGGIALVFHSHHLPQHKDRDLGFFRLARERGWHVRQVLKKRVGVMFEEDGGDVEDRAHVWGWEMRWPMKREEEEAREGERI